MKNLTWLLIAFVALLATSCSNEDSPGTDGSKMITFTVNPDPGVQTRTATGTILPSGGDKVLRYIMEVYDNTGAIVPNSRTVQTVTDESAPVTFTWYKEEGATYHVVFWADITGADKADVYYDTSTGLKGVTFNSGNTTDFYGEAFYGNADINSSEAAATSVTLKHAVSVVKLKTTAALEKMGSVKVTYGDPGNTNAPMSTFDASTGTASTQGTIAEKVNTVDPTQVATEADPYDFHTFYVFAPSDSQALITMKIEMCSDALGATVIKTSNVPNVPIRANYQTNITGNFGLATETYRVTCEAAWGGETLELSIWDGTAATVDASYTFGGKDGSTADNAYVIASAADLAQLAANVNAGTAYAGRYFKQSVDIDLNNTPWTSIGTSSSPFSGHYDGEGHTITNLKIESRSNNFALFGYVVGDNISIRNIHVWSTIDDSEAAGICGHFTGNNVSALNDREISGCSFHGTANGNAGHCGGIVTSATNAIITSCANYGEISSNTSAVYVGGIVADGTNCIVAGCYNAGTLTYDYSGTAFQIAGITNSNSKVIGCYNIGTIVLLQGSSTSGEVSISSINASDCYAKEPINSASFATGVTAFSSSWITTNGTWAAAAGADGSYTYDSGTGTFSNCKFWKSLGGWNDTESLRVYPKLWWEE